MKDVDFFLIKNKYVGAGGEAIVDNAVTQTTAGIDFGKFSAGLWSNYDMKRGKLNEVDVFGGIPIETKNVNLSIDAGIFAYPNSSYNEDGEVGLTLCSKDLPLDFSVYAGQAFTDGLSRSAGRIFKIGAGKTIALGDNINFTPKVSVTAQNRYFGNEIGFSHVNLEGCLSVSLGKNFGLSVHAGYQHPIDEKRFPNVENTLITGVGLNFNY